jgi:hypothetical protein
MWIKVSNIEASKKVAYRFRRKRETNEETEVTVVGSDSYK